MPAADLDHFDGYLRTLGGRLRGPGRLKADLLAEARDSLEDAASAYQDSGLCPADARRRAVAEFGEPGDLAPAYQAELGAVAAQRLALWLTVVPTVLGAGSDLMWRGAPWTGVQPPPGYATLATAVDRLGLLLAVAAFASLTWLAWTAHRCRPVSPAATRRMALGGLLGVTGLAVGGLSLYALTVSQARAALTWPPMIVGGLLTLVALGLLAGRAFRCMAWAGPR